MTSRNLNNNVATPTTTMVATYTQKEALQQQQTSSARGGKFGPNRYNNRGNYNGVGSCRGEHMEPTAQTCHGLVTIITTPFTTSPSKWRPLVVPC
ncbi:ALI_HP2_G0016820.mRNA.1.CDS.1 [Saccharomyces cerevisiae]|nr:ALI_HP2_G0016820.mRNA.1.CDS.1 [Saccharomyces cerevisiae]CAI6487295.1 ALI_HP2_G0016820.mRNA.1.CDS.1 [Saccharomyces cerevisiae]